MSILQIKFKKNTFTVVSSQDATDYETHNPLTLQYFGNIIVY